jgi:capsular exopolysaccharide synthesis family protein
MGRIEDAIRKAQAGQRSAIAQPVHGALARRRDEQTWRDDKEPPSEHEESIPSESKEPTIPESHIVKADAEHLLKHRVIAASEHDERVEPYRQLRTLILKTMRDNKWTTLAITSAHEGAGKTLTSANLAISLSKDLNTAVLLVDLDLKKPSVHKVLNLNPEKGLVDFLQGGAELEDILFSPGLDRLTVLAGRSAGKYSSELLASPKMKNLMRDLGLQAAANITIFDLPPLLRNDDAILFAPYADAVLVVVEDGVTTETQLQQSLHLLSKANVIGTILNKARG